jgi:beta-mannosidase
VSDQDARIEPNRLFFAPLKDLEFGQGTIETTIKSTAEGTATVELTAHGYHYLTRILTPAPGVRFSANYLDLRDGETRQIIVTGLPEHFDPANLLVTSYPSAGGVHGFGELLSGAEQRPIVEVVEDERNSEV